SRRRQRIRSASGNTVRAIRAGIAGHSRKPWTTSIPRPGAASSTRDVQRATVPWRRLRGLRYSAAHAPQCDLPFNAVTASLLRVAALGSTLAVAVCSAAHARQAPKPPFRWGGDAEGGAPFVEADPADPSRVRGFDVEVADMIARGLGRQPQFVQVAWASIGQSV